MNIKLILGVVLIAAFTMYASTAFINKVTPSTNFAGAKARAGQTVQVIGRWDRTDPATYTVRPTEFHFLLRDDEGVAVPVVYHSAKPQNLEHATSMTVEGVLQSDGSFRAEKILAKCPSKYQAEQAAGKQAK